MPALPGSWRRAGLGAARGSAQDLALPGIWPRLGLSAALHTGRSGFDHAPPSQDRASTAGPVRQGQYGRYGDALGSRGVRAR